MTARLILTVSLFTVFIIPLPTQSQHGRGRGPLGRGQDGDPAFIADRDLFHELPTTPMS